MPKKHKTNLYTKPPSTAHSSLSSTKHNGLSNIQDVSPSSVNDLLSNLRKADRSKNDRDNSMQVAHPPTMPPAVRQLLQMPETPFPRPRTPRRTDVYGHRLPAGPPPPSSWLMPSRSASGSAKNRAGERKYPENILHLPGVSMPSGLIHLCLKNLAKDWESQSIYNMHYFAIMPTRLRVLLLSYVAVYGPEDGVGNEALQNVIRPPLSGPDFTGNDNFHRLDVSGSIGRSISFSQLAELIVAGEGEMDSDEWDVEATSTIYTNPTTFLPCLTHLSLSHPPPNVSWTKFLNFAKNVPTITHLSLAHWPEPSLTPNSMTATIDSCHGSVQYGGTNLYSHSLDNDWSEAAGILKRLSRALYNLEFLNLDGCTEWAPALRWTESGINWKEHWRKIRIISLKSSYEVRETGQYALHIPNPPPKRQVISYKEAIIKAVKVETHIRKQRGWIAVEHDDWEKHDWLLDEDVVKDWAETMKAATFSQSDNGNVTAGGTRSGRQRVDAMWS